MIDGINGQFLPNVSLLLRTLWVFLDVRSVEIIPFVNDFFNVYIQPLGYDRPITLSVIFRCGEPPPPD